MHHARIHRRFRVKVVAPDLDSIQPRKRERIADHAPHPLGNLLRLEISSERQHVFDETIEIRDGAQNLVQVFDLFRLPGEVAPEHLGIERDAAERVADLVREPRGHASEHLQARFLGEQPVLLRDLLLELRDRLIGATQAIRGLRQHLHHAGKLAEIRF